MNTNGNMLKHFFLRSSGIIFVSLLLPPSVASAAPTATPTQDNVRYVGAVNCQSSMCHGGASPSRYQFTIWSQEDFHSRAYATLITSRSTRIAEGLGIAAATESSRCTVCHAPYETIPTAQLESSVHVTEGVSCEECHNAASPWLRGHTRPDWTYADCVHAGMRDLRSAYVRANTCVACHQVIDPDLLKAGHPELIFELDGQTASEPRHWKEKDVWFGPKAWLVGQAAALRDISLDLAAHPGANPDQVAQQQALFWLLNQVPPVKAGTPPDTQPSAIATWSDQLAQNVSGQTWDQAMTSESLTALAATADSFLDDHVSHLEQAMRAERLVMALDRLSKSLNGASTGQPPAGEAELSALFDAVHSREAFDPRAFSDELHKFADAIAKK